MSSVDTPLVEVRSVSKSFGSAKVLDGVSLLVERGKTTSLVGRIRFGEIHPGADRHRSGDIRFGRAALQWRAPSAPGEGGTRIPAHRGGRPPGPVRLDRSEIHGR